MLDLMNNGEPFFTLQPLSPNGAGLLKICLGKQIVFYRPSICLLSHQSLYGELRQCLKLGPQFLFADVLMHFRMKRI